MSARSILAIAATILATIILALSISFTAFAQAGRTCGPNMVQTSPGKPWDPTFKGTFKCTPRNLIDCGNGKSCPSGSACLYSAGGGPAGCKGVGLGPLCRDGKHCPAGYLCMPNGSRGCYNPATSYACGVAVCGKELRYGPGDRCYACYARRGRR
jgi:hypothetical protein